MLSHLRAFQTHHGRHVRQALKPAVLVSFATTARRNLLTLAIETSCDDTSVAVLEKYDSPHNNEHGPAAALHFHEKVTANSSVHKGIHPIVALESHQSELGPLVQKAILSLQNWKPDFISVTRGPGMRSNLSVGLDTAKGLSAAWRIPIVGVHHMQAHALTPRLMSALESSSATTNAPSPGFPFLSLLVSGGHSMLVNSVSLTHHTTLATTHDISLGDCLDKAARAILPASLLSPPYGRALEHFAFPAGESDYHYSAPKNREQELQRRKTPYGWALGPPLAETKGGRSSKKMAYSFSGLLSGVVRTLQFARDPHTGSLVKEPRAAEPELLERREMAREIMRVAFEHLASRVTLYLSSLSDQDAASINTLVVSGGVASNLFLRHVLRKFLDIRGFGHVQLRVPPVEFCTDNAVMIAWAGMEMFEAGYASDLFIRPLKTWSMDFTEGDTGILGVDGWTERKAYKKPEV